MRVGICCEYIVFSEHTANMCFEMQVNCGMTFQVIKSNNTPYPCFSILPKY